MVRDAQGKPKHDKHGKTIYRAAPILYTYVTNIAAEEMDADQVVALYGQRWGIEDFFEQMDNQFVWGRLPGTELGLVRMHIALSLLGYILLMEFKHVVAEWMNQAEYAVLSLPKDGTTPFCPCVLTRPSDTTRLAQDPPPRPTAAASASTSSQFHRKPCRIRKARMTGITFGICG